MTRGSSTGITSLKGLSEVSGAISSAVLTIARVGADRRDGPTSHFDLPDNRQHVSCKAIRICIVGGDATINGQAPLSDRAT
jgi:hypothetical protein